MVERGQKGSVTGDSGGEGREAGVYQERNEREVFSEYKNSLSDQHISNEKFL